MRQALGNATQDHPRDGRVTAASDDNEVGIYLVGDLRDLRAGLTQRGRGHLDGAQSSINHPVVSWIDCRFGRGGTAARPRV
jgi:hypothetical protein